MSFLVSFYTCQLIVDASKHDKDYSLTLKKYYGKLVHINNKLTDFVGTVGFYIGILCPTCIVVGAVVVYFVVMCQCLYPLVLCIATWCTGIEYDFQTKSVYNTFSQAYCGFIMYPVLIALTLKKDLSIFMKVGSVGVVFILFLMVFILAVGIKSFSNTEF